MSVEEDRHKSRIVDVGELVSAKGLNRLSAKLDGPAFVVKEGGAAFEANVAMAQEIVRAANESLGG